MVSNYKILKKTSQGHRRPGTRQKFRGLFFKNAALAIFLIHLKGFLRKPVTFVFLVSRRFNVDHNIVVILHPRLYGFFDLLGDRVRLGNRFVYRNLDVNANVPEPGYAPHPHTVGFPGLFN